MVMGGLTRCKRVEIKNVKRGNERAGGRGAWQGGTEKGADGEDRCTGDTQERAAGQEWKRE